MRRFLPCFGASRRRKHLQTHVADEDLKRQPAEQTILEEPITDTRSKIKLEKQSSKRGIKKSTHDLSANAYEEFSTKEAKKLEESTAEPERRGNEATPHIKYGPEATADSLKDEKKGEHEEADEVNQKSLLAESSESLFSLSIDSSKQVTADEKAEYEVDGPMPLGGAASNTKKGPGSFGSSHDGVQGKPVKAEENLAQGMPVKVKDSPDFFITKLEGTSKRNANRKVNFDLKVNTNEEPSALQIIRGDQDETPQISECPSSKASGKSSHFSRYRYQDCSDEECGDFDLGEGEFVVDDAENEGRGKGDGAVNRTWIQEESSESLFSLSTDSRKQVSGAEKADNEANSPMPESFVGRRGRIQNVSSVLIPIENIIQGRVGKATPIQPLKYEKENINSEKDVNDMPQNEESGLNVSNGEARHKKFDDKNQEEIGVDASLSSWLVEIETTPDSKNAKNSVEASTTVSKRSSLSPESHEDRPILGALSWEELRKFSVSSKASRRSKSRSPDETPIIGTVGSYWSYTGQTISRAPVVEFKSGVSLIN
ncbi:uncharacterized protein LOC129312799 isoform X2 [Prosopis cineraria]|uniref:uncharacterized protein LOC129312799 isoform X2 n=1 Tax=Prosopis cineraria TaxID=364024 RepID=UPI00240EFC88|nr:uncharacterized protein LOC129312799 isoform X2 [Prosopis cineraria]